MFKFKGWVSELVWTAAAILIALTIRAFIMEPYRIPSTSMEPTLHVGDFVFVSKYMYGPRIPFKTEHALWENNVQRGDVVVFKREAENLPGSLFGVGSTFFIKRVVAVPGDRVSHINKRLFVNGQQVPTQYQSDITYQLASGESRSAQQFTATMPEHRQHDILLTPYRPSPNLPEVQVPEGYYVVVGDNRDNSHDSRFWQLEPQAEEVVKGSPWRFVPRSDIIGRAEFILFSVGPGWNFRLNRIGRNVQPNEV